MGDKSGIEWTDATWNPVTGCTKVSQGCKHCYAERDWPRLVHLPAYQGRAFTDVACHPERLDQPLRWKMPRRIFVNSMSDLFHEDVPFEFIEEVHEVIRETERHTFQILTKRPDRMVEFWQWRKEVYFANSCTSAPPRNAWYGVSVEDQAAADERIPLLLQTPAAVRWISAEPLLGNVDLRLMQRSYGFPKHITKDGRAVGMPQGLHWVVVGGESGPKARPMHPDWARSLRDQCAAAGVPFLFKQWGEWSPKWGGATHLLYADGTYISGTHDHPDAWKHKTAEPIWRPGKKAACRLLDGVLHDGYPDGAD